MRAPKTFEDGISRLEDILAKMQSEETTLAEAVKLYAEAAGLVSFCSDTLDKAALQIEEIDARLSGAIPKQEQEQEEESDPQDGL